MLDGQVRMAEEVSHSNRTDLKEVTTAVSHFQGQCQAKSEDVNKNNKKTGAGLLGRYGCSTVSLFKGGGLEAKFEDGSMIHLAPCSSSFLLQLPPHRDTPYGCGLHKIEYKTKFPTSLCRDKVRQLVHLKNKVNSQHWVYLCHADVITTHSTTGAIKSSFSYLPFDPSIEDYSPINCLHGKKLPRHIEEYNWLYTDIRKLEDGSLTLWDTNKTVLIHLKPHRQTFIVTFLAPKRKTDNDVIGTPKSDASFTSSTPRMESSASLSEQKGEEKLEFVSATPRHKSVMNRKSLDSLKCNLGNKLNQMDETLQQSQNHDQSTGSSLGGSTPRAELNGADSGGRSEVANLVGVRKANWHQYVWVTQLQSVVVCHNIWRPAINLMLDYCRHSFISGLTDTEESSLTSSSVACLDQWVLGENCCSAYLHPWRARKGYMESRETTDLWSEDAHPLETFVTDNFTFRILELGDDGSGGMDCNTERTGCLFVEVDLPDESLLRSEFDQFSPYKKPDLFMRYDFNKTMQNVKSVTISLSNPPPKLPGHVYDLGQVAQQAADLLSSVIGTTCKQRSSSQSLSCVKKSLERTQEDLSLLTFTINSPRPNATSTLPSTIVDESTHTCGTIRDRFMGPYVTEQTQVEGVGEFWAYSTGRVRVAFVDGVFLDMKLLTGIMDATLMSSAAGTPRNMIDDDGMMTPRRSMGSSTSAADLPPGLARMLMKDGTYQFVNVFTPPAQYTRYVLAATEWCNWIRCPEGERQEAFTSDNYIDVLVQSELTKIRNFNYLKENALNFHNLSKRPEPVGGASPNESSNHSHNNTLTANDSKTDVQNVQHNQQSKMTNIVPPIAIKDLINSTPSKHSNMRSQSNTENVAMFANFPSVRKAHDEKPKSEAVTKISGRSIHVTQLGKADEETKANQSQSDVTVSLVEESPKWTSSEGSLRSCDVSSLSPKTTDDETSAKMMQLKQCQNLIQRSEPNMKTSSVADYSSLIASGAPKVPSKEMKKVEDSVPANERTARAQQSESSAGNENATNASKPEVSQYKQSELQNEIQKIIQKTRKDLEILEAPSGVNIAHALNTHIKAASIASPVEGNGKSVAVTEIEQKSKENVDVNNVGNVEATKSVPHFAVPPPMEFSEGAQQLIQISSTNQDETNVSLISRPKSPPAELLTKPVSAGSRGGSPPRSPPPIWRQGKQFVAAASSALGGGGDGTSNSATSTQNKTESNFGKMTSGRRDATTDDDKFDISPDTDSESRVENAFSPPPMGIHASTPVDNKNSSHNFANSENAQKTTNSIATHSNNASKLTRNDLVYVSPQQLKEGQNLPVQTTKAKPQVQQFGSDIDDVDKFISENSTGLDVQFDFASVTDALFKTQQAIKTIDSMLEKSTGTGNGKCSHIVPEVSSLDLTQNNELSNDIVESR